MENSSHVATGIAGLEQVLPGGLASGRSYLISGGPGTGKTLLGLQFTAAAPADDSASLYITFGQSAEHVRADTEGLDLDLSEVEFLDLSPASDYFADHQDYDIFHPAEVERGPMTRQIIERVREIQPSRVVIDSMTEFEYLTETPGQFRKQVLGFLQFLTDHGATVVYTAETASNSDGDVLGFIGDGIIELSNDGPHRTIEVTKLRGSDFHSGKHTLTIGTGGTTVYPRLKAGAPSRAFRGELVGSGVPEVDQLLDGGLHRGTITIISGSSGVGKTTLGLQFMKGAAGRGERSVIFNFEEDSETILYRGESINMPLRQMVKHGRLHIHDIRPGQLSYDEFTHLVRTEVEERDSQVVMIDSIDGFVQSVDGPPAQRALILLTNYLVNQNATVLLTDEIKTITGDFEATGSHASYVADNLVFLRYLELHGELRKAIGVLKKRTSDFEKALREFEITSYGIKVGAPLKGLRGILQGMPEWHESPQEIG